MYEKQYCRGNTSNVTHILREIYDNIFSKTNPIVNLDLGISSLVKDSTPNEFNRATILSVLGIAFLKYF